MHDAPAAAPAPAPASPCPNCGDAGAARFCPACGQDQHHELRRPVRRLVVELLEETLSLDGKLLRTLPALLRRPGSVAAELAAGRRARYTSPLRLYLGASLLLFVATALGARSGEPKRFMVVALGQAPVALTPAPGERAAAERDLAALVARLRADGGRAARFVADRLEHLAGLPPGEVARRYAAAFAEDSPRALFLLVPLLALLLKAAHRRRYFAEHLVLALHAQTVGFLALVPGALSGWDPLTWLGEAAGVAWFALALRRIEGMGWGRTALEVVAVGAGYGLALALVLAVTSLVALLAV